MRFIIFIGTKIFGCAVTHFRHFVSTLGCAPIVVKITLRCRRDNSSLFWITALFHRSQRHLHLTLIYFIAVPLSWHVRCYLSQSALSACLCHSVLCICCSVWHARCSLSICVRVVYMSFVELTHNIFCSSIMLPLIIHAIKTHPSGLRPSLLNVPHSHIL